MKKVLLFALVMFFGAAAFAQDAPVVQLPKVQIVGDFSYIYAQQYGFIPSYEPKGGGGSIAYFFNKHIGLLADFQYYGSQTFDFSVPALTQGCNSPSPCPLRVEGNAFSYNLGPVLRFRFKRVEPFAEFLFGGVHNQAYGNLYNDCLHQGECLNLARQPNDNAFDLVIGGGVDIPISDHFSIRAAQVDFMPTHFGTSLAISNSTQDNLRFQAGLVFRF